MRAILLIPIECPGIAGFGQRQHLANLRQAHMDFGGTTINPYKLIIFRGLPFSEMGIVALCSFLLLLKLPVYPGQL